MQEELRNSDCDKRNTVKVLIFAASYFSSWTNLRVPFFAYFLLRKAKKCTFRSISLSANDVLY